LRFLFVTNQYKTKTKGKNIANSMELNNILLNL